MTDSEAPSFSGPELCSLKACEAVELLSKGEISPQDLLDASEQRVGEVEPSVNALPTLCFDRARDDAKEISTRSKINGQEPGWLGGLPISIKDLNNVEGVLTTFGSQGFAEFIAPESDILVEHLEQQGGLVVAKSNTPEMGAGGNTFNAVFGATRNSWDTRMTAGGSSGGAAVSVATGEVWLAQGSDLAGSLRTPAAYNGVVGLRPSPGRVARGPGENPFDREAVQGPIARNVMDIALFLDAMSGFDPRDPVSIESPAESFQDSVRRAEPKINMAFSADLNGFSGVEPDVETTIRKMLGKLEGNGATVEEDCPPLPGLYDAYRTLRAMVWATGPGQLPQARQAHFKQTLTDNIAVGHKLNAQQIFEASRVRGILYKAMQNFLTKHDVFAIPTVPLSPLPVEQEYPTKIRNMIVTDYLDWLRFSFLATTTALPAISLPAGLNEDGMPVGVQLIGPPRGEAKLLQAAAMIEQVTGFGTVGPIDPVVRHL